ncbi:MAG: hypothetical protein WBH77_05375 [Saccharofermentanales bacterium]
MKTPEPRLEIELTKSYLSFILRDLSTVQMAGGIESIVRRSEPGTDDLLR